MKEGKTVTAKVEFFRVQTEERSTTINKPSLFKESVAVVFVATAKNLRLQV